MPRECRHLGWLWCADVRDVTLAAMDCICHAMHLVMKALNAFKFAVQRAPFVPIPAAGATPSSTTSTTMQPPALPTTPPCWPATTCRSAGLLIASL